jgi:hypothetical protein
VISGFLPAREPIQDLYELKLIVKVVFKPQDYRSVVVETGDCFVSPRKRNLRERHVEKLREEPFPNPAQFLERQTARNRPSCRMSSQQTTWPGSPVWGIETDSPLVMWSIANKAANREIAQAGA